VTVDERVVAQLERIASAIERIATKVESIDERIDQMTTVVGDDRYGPHTAVRTTVEKD